MMVCCAPTLTGFILFVSFLPESPRYLFVQKEYERLKKTLQYIQKVNRKTSFVIERIDLIHLSVSQNFDEEKKKNFAENNDFEIRNDFHFNNKHGKSNVNFEESFDDRFKGNKNNLFLQLSGLFDKKNRRMFFLQLVIWFTLCFGQFYFFYFFIFLFFYLFIYLFIYLFFIYLFINLFFDFF